ILFEGENVLNVSSAKSINALRIIPYYTNILVNGSKLFQDRVLSIIRILELIHENVFEFMLVLVQGLRRFAEQYIRIIKQIIEVHARRFETTLYIQFEQQTHFGL